MSSSAKSASYRVATGIIIFTSALAVLNFALNLSKPVIIMAVLIKLLASTFKLVYLHEKTTHPHHSTADHKALALIVSGLVGVAAIIIIGTLTLLVSLL
jgi:hypothetical protein